MATVTRRAVLGGALLRANARPALCASSRLAVATPLSSTPSVLLRPSAALVTPRGLGSDRRWFSQKKPTDNEEEYEGPLAAVKDWSYKDIIEELEKQKGDGPKSDRVVFIDVREPAELKATGWIPGAINIPITSAVQSFHMPAKEFAYMQGYNRPAPQRRVVMYCKAGVRALSAAGLAVHAGYRNVGVYKGSWNDWASRGGPVSHDTSHYDTIDEQPDSAEWAWEGPPLDPEEVRARRRMEAEEKHSAYDQLQSWRRDQQRRRDSGQD